MQRSRSLEKIKSVKRIPIWRLPRYFAFTSRADATRSSPLVRGRLSRSLIVILVLTTGCASQDAWRTSLEPEDAQKKARAHPAAYGVSDTFTFGKPHRVRPANEFLFYYKECGLTDPQGDRAYFSKTAYACTGPR